MPRKKHGTAGSAQLKVRVVQSQREDGVVITDELCISALKKKPRYLEAVYRGIEAQLTQLPQHNLNIQNIQSVSILLPPWSELSPAQQTAVLAITTLCKEHNIEFSRYWDDDSKGFNDTWKNRPWQSQSLPIVATNNEIRSRMRERALIEQTWHEIEKEIQTLSPKETTDTQRLVKQYRRAVDRVINRHHEAAWLRQKITSAAVMEAAQEWAGEKVEVEQGKRAVEEAMLREAKKRVVWILLCGFSGLAVIAVLSLLGWFKQFTPLLKAFQGEPLSGNLLYGVAGAVGGMGLLTISMGILLGMAVWKRWQQAEPKSAKRFRWLLPFMVGFSIFSGFFSFIVVPTLFLVPGVISASGGWLIAVTVTTGLSFLGSLLGSITVLLYDTAGKGADDEPNRKEKIDPVDRKVSDDRKVVVDSTHSYARLPSVGGRPEEKSAAPRGGSPTPPCGKPEQWRQISGPGELMKVFQERTRRGCKPPRWNLSVEQWITYFDTMYHANVIRPTLHFLNEPMRTVAQKGADVSGKRLEVQQNERPVEWTNQCIQDYLLKRPVVLGEKPPTVMDFANAYWEGGGFAEGEKDTQEEDLCVYSNAALGMPAPRRGGDPKKYDAANDENYTGFDEIGGGYSVRNITPFEQFEDPDGIQPKPVEDNRFHMVVVAGPDLRAEELEGQGRPDWEMQGRYKLLADCRYDRSAYIQKIEKIYRVAAQAALDAGSDTLIFGPIACGYFKNNPYLVAAIARAVLSQPEYVGLNKLVYNDLKKSSTDVFRYVFEQLSANDANHLMYNRNIKVKVPEGELGATTQYVHTTYPLAAAVASAHSPVVFS